MAVSRDFVEKIEALTKCSICCGQCRDHRSLPCFHAFCLECIQSYGRDKNPGEEMACPLCKVGFNIPDGGLLNLSKNFVLGKLIEAQQSSSSSCDVADCDVCMSAKQTNESSGEVQPAVQCFIQTA